MKGFTLEMAVSACGGEYRGPAGPLPLELSGVVTDSREVIPGCLFIAIPGERTDGHDYVGKAAAAGAVCSVCERAPEDGSPYILVKSSVAALQAVAAAYRGLFHIPFIGITGSVGKTTVKEMLYAVMSRRFNTLKTEKNNNSQIGLPLTMFSLGPEHEAAVIEMGLSYFGEMTRLTNIVHPDMAVFTVIGEAHLEFLHDREGVLRAKTELLPGMPESGTVFINGDDDMLRRIVCPQEIVSFGLGADCDVRAENIESSDGCMLCDIAAGDRRIPVRIPAFGAHMVTAALAAAAVGIKMGLTDAEIAAGVGDYETVGSRMKTIDTGYLTILDDSYNSNPTSCASSIASLGCLEGRRVCVLGDMLELGESSAKLHREVGELAAAGSELVLSCGPESEPIALGAREAGAVAWHFSDTRELLTMLPALIKRGDAVLVKASRGMRFEDVTAALAELR